MSAKDWLEQEELENPLIKSINNNSISFQGYRCDIIMERFANYKTRDLQVQIFTFRDKILKDKWIEQPYRYNEDFLKEFDTHFGIE